MIYIPCVDYQKIIVLSNGIVLGVYALSNTLFVEYSLALRHSSSVMKTVATPFLRKKHHGHLEHKILTRENLAGAAAASC